MRQSAATLEAFYDRRLGAAAADRIGQRLIDLWGPCTGETVLGIGYAKPVLKLWKDTAKACIAAVPGDMGETHYSNGKGGLVTLTPEDRLPFTDASFDRIVMLHALEEADHPKQVLREAWRLLAPEGRIVVAVANRRSLWSVTEAQAFGHGRPWTRRQIIRFMTDGLFQVTASTCAVHMPPLDWRMITAASRSWERAGDLVLPGLGGVVLVEAVKRLYARPGGSAPATVTQPVKDSIGRQTLPRRDAVRTNGQDNDKN